MTITVRTNLPEFKSKLNFIKADLQKKAVRQATRAAGSVIQKLAKKFAPVRDSATRKKVRGQLVFPGTLRDSIGVVSKRARPGTIKVMVIPRSGKRTRKGKGSMADRDAYYWAWVEQGHVITGRRVKGGARRRKLERDRLNAAGRRTRPANYLKKAFEQGKDPAVKAFYAKLEIAVQKYSRL